MHTSKRQLLRSGMLAIAMAMAGPHAASAQDTTLQITVENGQFSPAELRAPANKPLVIMVKNNGAKAMEKSWIEVLDKGAQDGKSPKVKCVIDEVDADTEPHFPRKLLDKASGPAADLQDRPVLAQQIPFAHALDDCPTCPMASVISFIIGIVRMFNGGLANVMRATRSVIAN